MCIRDSPYFDRGVVPQVKYAGMLQYDGDLCIPKRYLCLLYTSRCV